MEGTENVLREVTAERLAQDSKWGEQNHLVLDPTGIEQSKNFLCYAHRIPTEEDARFQCEIAFKHGVGTWLHILIEEMSEVASCGSDKEALRKELIQVAAVAVAAVESLDRLNVTR